MRQPWENFWMTGRVMDYLDYCQLKCSLDQEKKAALTATVSKRESEERHEPGRAGDGDGADIHACR